MFITTSNKIFVLHNFSFAKFNEKIQTRKTQMSLRSATNTSLTLRRVHLPQKGMSSPLNLNGSCTAEATDIIESQILFTATLS